MNELICTRRIVAGIFAVALAAGTARAAIGIRLTPGGSGTQKLAAKEVARYMYLRTGLLPEQIAEQGTIIIARKDAALLTEATVRAAARDLQPQQYVLKTTVVDGKKTWWIVGGDDQGTLYGAYRFAEKLGVRFYLHGDVIPDERLARIPDVDETGKPLFALRGVNPWGSHPFGFDAWGGDDYKAIITQLAKMRMNFFGIHCYPEGHPYAEPTVWHGLPGDFDEQGRVKFSYTARYFNTLLTPAWGGYVIKKTGNYSFGGALLFDRDDWAPPVLVDHCPLPATPDACNDVFNRMAGQFRDAFSFARQLGVKTCLGTEAPMTIPKAVRDRLRAQDKNPGDPAVVRDVYEGTFRRIMASHPLDYYWIWTPESWRARWEPSKGNTPEQYRATVDDIKLAIEAVKNTKAPFKLATAGWVLGPANDRAAFDNELPKDVPMSALSEDMGHLAVAPAFGRISGREKWAIPWLESDGHHGLAAVQLFAGRMRCDAADALAYGCTGLMGLQWRTAILGPNVAALAEAAWDQSGWNPSPGKLPAESVAPVAGPLGGVIVAYSGRKVSGTADPVPYQTCRYNCDDLYADWAAANFGPEASAAIGRLFASVDGKVPVSVARGCPSGSLAPDSQPWEKVSQPYAFVDELGALRPQVKGPGNLDRFDYWLNTFRYHRLLAEIRCALGIFETAMKQAEAASAPAVRRKQAESTALPAYKEVLRLYSEAYRLLLATVNTPGGLATVVNLENHSQFWPVALDKPATRLIAARGSPLPPDAVPPKQYQGTPRIIVPTLRTLLSPGEALRLKVIVLDNQPARSAAILWRPMGVGPLRTMPLKHVARAVYQVDLPSPGEDFEYRIEATTADGKNLVWPATAPQMIQTVLLWKD